MVAAEVATIRTRDKVVNVVTIFHTLYRLRFIISIGHSQLPTTKVPPYSILWLSVLL